MIPPVNYDVVVLGAGPGGYVAAIRCAQLGLKTAIIEDQHMGGICLNWGCIPTKALLRTSEVYHVIQNADSFGIIVKDVSFDLKKIVGRSRDIAQKLATGIRHLLKKNKVDVYEGWGALRGGNGTHHVLDITQNEKTAHTLHSKHVILATGAKARELPHFIPNGTSIWNVRHAMTPTRLPSSLLIMGSGAIGVEFASFYHALGVKVTLIEMQDRILPVEDEDISTLALKNFKKQGIEILTSTTADYVTHTDNTITVRISSGKTSDERAFDAVLPAVGIQGNTTGYGLEATTVQVERSHIITNEFCETHEKNIFAIGDVTQGPWLAHKASHEGIIVAEKIAGLSPYPLKIHNIPGCTYSYPQIASVGMTEAKALEAGYTLRVGRFPFHANGKALALGESEGLVKVIYDTQTGELLGAHMIGSEVTELIQGFVIAKTAELTEEDLMHTIFPHPTLSEMMPESVLDAYNRPLHM